jgi:hypothetical protein
MDLTFRLKIGLKFEDWLPKDYFLEWGPLRYGWKVMPRKRHFISSYLEPFLLNVLLRLHLSSTKCVSLAMKSPFRLDLV